MPEFDPRSGPPEIQPGIDHLTNLPNRSWLSHELESFTAAMPGQFAAVFIDLDRLKRLNDTNGHEAGDELIKKSAKVLSYLTRHEDTKDARKHDKVARVHGRGVYRHGGDEFVVLLAGVSEQHEVSTFIKRARDNLATHGVEASIAGRPHMPGETADMLLDDVDALMYLDKKSRRQERLRQMPRRARAAHKAAEVLSSYTEKWLG